MAETFAPAVPASAAAILRALKGKPATQEALAAAAGLSPTAARKHLRRLRELGLVARRRGEAGAGRPPWVYVALGDAQDQDLSGPSRLFLAFLSHQGHGEAAVAAMAEVVRAVLKKLPHVPDLSPHEKLDRALAEIKHYWAESTLTETGRGALLDPGPCALSPLKDNMPELRCPCRAILQEVFADDIARGRVAVEEASRCTVRIRLPGAKN